MSDSGRKAYQLELFYNPEIVGFMLTRIEGCRINQHLRPGEEIMISNGRTFTILGGQLAPLKIQGRDEMAVLAPTTFRSSAIMVTYDTDTVMRLLRQEATRACLERTHKDMDEVETFLADLATRIRQADTRINLELARPMASQN